MSNKDKFIAKYVLEIKLSNKDLAFLSKRGVYAKQVIEKLSVPKFLTSNERFDLASEDESEKYFISWENYGLELEAKKDFDVFSGKAKKLFDALSELEDYKKNKIARIGVRGQFFFHKQGKGFNDIKGRYEKLFLNKDGLEQSLGGNIIDVGLHNVDFKINNRRINISVGPAKKEEVIEKFYKNNTLYKEFKNNAGLYLDIDVGLTVQNAFEKDNLNDEITNNIKILEEKFQAIVAYFFSEETRQ
jgi:hypothetical protein